MGFKEIFKLSVGQVALRMFGPLLLIPFIGIFGILAFYIFLALWLYYLGTELFLMLPNGHKLNLWRFKFYYFGMLLCFLYTAYKSYMVIYSDSAFDNLVRMAPVLNILILFFLLNTMYFIAKEIILIKDNKTEVNFFDSMGVFISFWLLPFFIGILFLQPTIKLIFEKQSEKEALDSEEEQKTKEITEEVLINYSPHKYKCPEGELIINQELHQPNIGEEVLLNGIPAPTGKYKIGFLQTIIVVDGKVANDFPVASEEEIIPKETKEEKAVPTFTKHIYQSSEGELVIEQEFQMPNQGEIAYLDGKPAPTGNYEIGLFRSIYIIDGKVSKKNN